MEDRTLGDYRIIKTIGQGTMGLVYLAEHRFMKRQYALKVLPEELASDRGFIQRFEEEIGSLAALEHPHIVKTYNISFSQGQYFLVTDCIVDDLGETTNLAKYLVGLRRQLEEEEIFHILMQIADALNYAHTKKLGQKEIVHRGLKPNNVLIGKNKQGIHIYLSDFGLSRIIGPGALLTRTFKNVAEALGIAHQIIAKPGLDRYPNPIVEQQKLTPLHTSFLQNFAFLSPEQKRLDMPHPIDAKSDVYAFGILAYYLLMNELPEGLFEMPSSRGLIRFQWDKLMAACLQSNPSKRPLDLKNFLLSIQTTKTPHDLLVPLKEQVKKMEEDIEFISKPPFFKPCEIPPLPTEEVWESLNFDEKTLPKLAIEELALVSQEAVKAYSNASEAHAIPAIKRDEITVELKEVRAEVGILAHSSALSIKEDLIEAPGLRPSLQISQLERPQTDLNPGAIFQVSSSVKAYNPEPKDVTDLKPILTDMVIIPGGTVFRGSQDGNRDEMPRHPVTLKSFAIDIHPVANEQFVRFLEVMGGEKDSNHNDIIRLRDSRIKRSGGKLMIESGYSRHPVVGVTWYGAVAYAKWVGKRLPTEAEWEIAARGKRENALYPTGDDIEKTQANFFSSDTTAVMSYAPNDYGLYDLAGNVYEWCHDWYGYNYYEVSIQEPENPQGPLQGVYRVLRGGCWKSLKEDLRCSRRHRNNPGTVNSTYGFRCAAGVQ